MPVYTNDADTLQDFFKRKIKDNNYWIEPMILSEWIYGYNGDDMLGRINPEVFSMLKEAKKIAPTSEEVDIITELFIVVNDLYNHYMKEDTKAWQKYYEELHTPTTKLAIKYLQEQ